MDSPSWLIERALVNTPLAPVFDLRDDETYDLGFFSAPVLDATRQVAFALAISGLNRSASGAEVKRIGARLRAACDRITGAMVGPGATRN